MEKNLGRYKIESKLGSGAYADVYKAVDSMLKRTVALKVLKPMLVSDEEAYARFIQEAQVLANLHHDHIAWVWDLGEAEGRSFIAMRYVDGTSLEQVLKEKGSLTWKEARSITQDVAAALAYAHEKGLVHRDVKPGNILISKEEGAVLTDFGLVKAMQGSGMTRTLQMVGTPQYMAPEVLNGQPATAAADQFALGCVLVEMLTGKSPFEAPTPMAVLMKHMQPLELPGTWPNGVPQEIEIIIRKMLAKNSTERYNVTSNLINEVSKKKSFIQPNAISSVQYSNKMFFEQPDDMNLAEEGIWVFKTKLEVEVLGRLKGKEDWLFLGNTPGEVVIPPEYEVKLYISKLNEAELEILLKQEWIEKGWRERIRYIAILGINFNKLAPLKELTNLIDLSLWGYPQINDIDLINLNKQQVNPTRLYLQGYTQITNSSLAIIGNLTQLTDLNIGNCKKITDAGLTKLSNLKKLTKLNLAGCDCITNAGLAILRALENLSILGLSVCWQINDAGLAYLQEMSKLTSLDISACRDITDTGLELLGGVKKLVDLNLRYCVEITDSGLAHLSNLTNLVRLNLSQCNGITDLGLPYLQKLRNLSSLSLSSCKRFTDAGLVQLHGLANLTQLDLGYCPQITDASLAHLQELTKLSSLDLEGCQNITDIGLALLCRLPYLAKLDLSGCKQITDNGLANLADLTSLTSLDLQRCKQVTDTGLAHLLGLMNLTSLDLRKCEKITDEGLTQLLGINTLTHLRISQSYQITEACIEKFEARGVEIYR